MENEKKNQTNEEYYAVVIWKDAESKHHIVGTLAYFEGKYYFKYEQTALKDARAKNFTDVASFNDDKKIYISENSLFDFFKNKVEESLQNSPKALEELIKTRGRTTTDDISVMPIPETFKGAIKAEMKTLERIQKEQMKKEEQDDCRDD